MQLPAPGLLRLIELGSSLILAGPLLIATAIFINQGQFAFAAFTASLAIIALYLPTYILNKLTPSSILPRALQRR